MGRDKREDKSEDKRGYKRADTHPYRLKFFKHKQIEIYGETLTYDDESDYQAEVEHKFFLGLHRMRPKMKLTEDML